MVMLRPPPGASLGEAARDAITWLEEAIGGLSTAQWVLLILAAAALGWVIANVRALTRLGPIDVQPLEHDVANVRVKRLTAIFREALARSGLMAPPAVPSGVPQVNLLAAVEASNISQAAWVAKLIAMVPRPRPHEYKISGTLHGTDPEAAAEPAEGNAVDEPVEAAAEEEPNTTCGISVWVRPAREGRELLETYDAAPTHMVAVQRAATEIYLHISNHAVEAFPIWARWRDRAALAAYREACKLLANADMDGAIAKFETAAARERFNKLAHLQLANIYEQQALLQPTALQTAIVQAFALRRYLAILDDFDSIVEAHYRAGIVASSLATRAEQLPDAAKQRVVNALALEGVEVYDQLVPALKALAERENRAALHLLAPFYAVLNEARVRTQYEPRGHERRQLKHSAAISKHCIRARAALDQRGDNVDRDLRRRELAVHWGHLRLGWGTLSWQAFYNAACFDALLLERRRRLAVQAPPPQPPPPQGPSPP
jgi:hypothetical protein